MVNAAVGPVSSFSATLPSFLRKIVLIPKEEGSEGGGGAILRMGVSVLRSLVEKIL
jgi:hypothetical protein